MMLSDFLRDHHKVEKKNIAASHPEVIEGLKREHKEWEKRLIDPLWPGFMHIRFQIGSEVYYYAM
jgi:hypothetical protein